MSTLDRSRLGIRTGFLDDYLDKLNMIIHPAPVPGASKLVYFGKILIPGTLRMGPPLFKVVSAATPPAHCESGLFRKEEKMALRALRRFLELVQNAEKSVSLDEAQELEIAWMDFLQRLSAAPRLVENPVFGTINLAKTFPAIFAKDRALGETKRQGISLYISELITICERGETAEIVVFPHS